MSQNQRKDQVDECYAPMRNMLILGQIPPGQRIKETEWAEKLGVHRGAIKVASHLLAHEGLLVRGEKAGFYVPKYTNQQLTAVFTTRVILETGALKLYASRPKTGDELAPLKKICNVMEDLLHNGYMMGFAEADQQFHSKIVEIGGNPELIRAYNHLGLIFIPSLHWNGQILKHGKNTLKGHREILELLKQDKADEAIVLLEQHLGDPFHCCFPQDVSANS